MERRKLLVWCLVEWEIAGMHINQPVDGVVGRQRHAGIAIWMERNILFA